MAKRPPLELSRARYGGRFVLAALLLAYVIIVARSPAVGLGDTSNHLARAYIMADLLFHHGVHFGAQFQYHFLAIPYILLDLLLATALELLGPRVVVAAWTVMTFVSVPAALFLYFRVLVGTKSTVLLEDEAAWILLLCAAYLSTDFFFIEGFFAFQLGLATVIGILAVIELLRRRWSAALFGLYGASLIAAYLIHLTALVFIAAIITVSAAVRLWCRSTSLHRELLLIAPVCAVFAWHFGVAVHYGPATDVAAAFGTWGTLREKLAWLALNYHRYGGALDALSVFLYAACLVTLAITRNWREAFVSSRVIESIALTATFFSMYLVLPFALGDATYVDVRALAPAALFILLACLNLPRADRSRENGSFSPSLAVAAAIVLSALNLAYLARHFSELSSWSTKVRTLFAEIPIGAHILPVQTSPGRWRYIDASAIAVIDRYSVVPYLFSADTGAPQRYFRYVDYPYAPRDDWYIRSSPSSVDWLQIACTYQEILVMQPFTLRRVRIAAKVIAENSSAALLRIDPGECTDRIHAGS